METNYLIPANSKRGNLIFSIFKPIDLVIFLVGIGITLLLLISLNSSDTVMMVLILTPAVIAAGLVMPVPNQHNVRVLLIAIFKYFTSQQKFKWKGWSIHENFE